MLRILQCAALLAGAARADCEKDSDCKAGPLQAGFLYAYRLNSKMQLAAGPWMSERSSLSAASSPTTSATGFGTTVSTGGLDFRSFSVYGTVRL